MQKKKWLPHIVLLLCLALSYLPFHTTVANGERLFNNAMVSEKNVTDAPSLSGVKAIEYLKQSGNYQTLAKAVGQLEQQESSAASLQQSAYLNASYPDSGDKFGTAVAISGDTVVIGAQNEDGGSTGVNGDQTSNSKQDSGAVYVFVRNGNGWSEQAYIKASNSDASDYFGFDVAIDGDTLVVSAIGEASNATGVNGMQNDNSTMLAGAAYVFVRSGVTWSQQAYLKASNPDTRDMFGNSVDISGDTIVVGARNEQSSAKGVNGNQNDNNADLAGAAYVFVRNGTAWSQQAYLKASNTDPVDWFGHSVAVSGNSIVVSAFFEDSNATGINGDQNDNSQDRAGAAYVFERNGTVWIQMAYLKTPTALQCLEDIYLVCPHFGDAVDILGDTIVVGSHIPFTTAHLFVRSGSTWSFQTSYSTNFNEMAYLSLSLSEDRFVLGADSLSARVVGRNGTAWNEEALLPHSITGLAVDGKTVAAGEFSGSQGTGAVYIYTIAPPPTCGGLLQEAETSNAVLTGFTVNSDPAASGGSFIGALPGGNYYNGPNLSFKAEYCFNVPTSGTYRIKAKTYAANDLSDSFYVQVDGAPAYGYLWDVAQNTSYAPDYVNGRNNADPVELNLTAGQHNVTVYLREQGTRLDTIELEAVPTTPAPVCAGLVQEAETGVIAGDWEIGGDSAASGGQFIHAPNGSGDFWNGASSSQKASYCFNVVTAGSYRIKGKVYGADTLSDSFYVQIDGAPSSGYLWDILPNTTYASDFVNDRGVVDPVEVQFTAGQHTVNLFVREDGTRLDTIELQLVDSGPPPTPVCAGLTQEAETGALRGNFTLGSDTAASGGQYVGTPAGSGDFWNGPNARHSVSYCFNVPTAGTYRIDGKVYGADTLSDSFYVQVDGAPTSGYLWDVLPNTSYAVDSVNNRNLADPVLVTLSSGQHTVTVYARESGTRLDTIQLVATTPAPQSRAIPILAQGVHGTIHLNTSHLSAEVDFSTIQLTLSDAETNRQSFRQTVTADRFGSYHFDGMTPGKYVVQMQLPSGLLADTSAVTVTATADEPVNVIFEVSAGNKNYLPLIGR